MTYYLQHSEWYNQVNIPEGMNLEMLNNDHRLDQLIRPALIRSCSGKVVIDLGCGTGLLGLTALSHGAEFVYFVEQDPQMFHILESVLDSKLQPGQYCLINRDIESLTVEDFSGPVPAIAVSEFYGPTLYDEGYVFYVQHLKSLFSNLRFIPEQFDIEVSICDVDYDSPIWPNDSILLDHFKFMYSEKGYNSHSTSEGHVPVTAVRPQGEITYDTRTEQFNNTVELQSIADQEQLVHCWCVVRHEEFEHRASSFGWFIPCTDQSHSYTVSISLENDETVFQPRFNKT